MGFTIDDQGGVTYREWAPGATEARLIGDFSESTDLVIPGQKLTSLTNGRTPPTP